MNINRNGENYREWCQMVGVNPNDMDMKISDALFGCLVELMLEPVEGYDGVELGTVVEEAEGEAGDPGEEAEAGPQADAEGIGEGIDLDGLGEDALKIYIAEKGGKFHHMNKRETLLEIAKGL